MRIMIDTNVLISASLFEKSKIAEMVEHIADNHYLILCDVILDEMKSVYKRKFPNKIKNVDLFLTKFPYELVYAPTYLDDTPDIRDLSDKPILASAILEDVDILISGDNDFSEVEIDRPEILTPAEFLERY